MECIVSGFLPFYPLQSLHVPLSGIVLTRTDPSVLLPHPLPGWRSGPPLRTSKPLPISDPTVSAAIGVLLCNGVGLRW